MTIAYGASLILKSLKFGLHRITGVDIALVLAGGVGKVNDGVEYGPLTHDNIFLL